MKSGNKKTVAGSTIKVKLPVSDRNQIMGKIYLDYLDELNVCEVARKLTQAGDQEGEKILQTWLSGIPMNRRLDAISSVSSKLFKDRFKFAYIFA